MKIAAPRLRATLDSASPDPDDIADEDAAARSRPGGRGSERSGGRAPRAERLPADPVQAGRFGPGQADPGRHRADPVRRRERPLVRRGRDPAGDHVVPADRVRRPGDEPAARHDPGQRAGLRLVPVREVREGRVQPTAGCRTRTSSPPTCPARSSAAATSPAPSSPRSRRPARSSSTAPGTAPAA